MLEEGVIVDFFLILYARSNWTIIYTAKYNEHLPAQHFIPHLPIEWFDISILIGKGIPTADVQQLVRHASYQTTIDIYRHLLPNQLEKGLDDFDLALLSVERMN